MFCVDFYFRKNSASTNLCYCHVFIMGHEYINCLRVKFVIYINPLIGSQIPRVD